MENTAQPYPALLNSDVGRNANGNILGLYRCMCGAEFRVANTRIRNGQTRSCGCLSRTSKPGLTHGMRNSPEYRSWSAMVGRCHNEGHKDYPNYGARGISVCEEWRASFDAFYEHVGERPDGTTIDRIDNAKGYVRGNVRWATRSEQQRNKRGSVTWHIKGLEFQTAKLAGEHFGVSQQTIHRWVKGFFDNRRGTKTPPKEGCFTVGKY